MIGETLGFVRPVCRPRRVFVEAKETVRALLDRLPDDCTLEDVLYHLYVIQEVEAGIRELDEGRGIPHEQVAAELRRKWRLGAE
jgi:hypothetical protein